MTGIELRKALRDLGWRRSVLARKIDVGPSTVSRWTTDDHGAVPGPVAAYVVLALQVKRLSMEVTGG